MGCSLLTERLLFAPQLPINAPRAEPDWPRVYLAMRTKGMTLTQTLPKHNCQATFAGQGRTDDY